MKITLFDLDGTLIPGDSDHAFGEFLVELGWADASAYRQRNDWFYAEYQAGRLDLSAYIEFATAPWRSRCEAELVELQQRFMAQVIAPQIAEAARDLVRSHQQAGDRVAIITATNEFITAPIAAAFGVAELIALQLERDPQGRVTGAIRGVPSYREGKVERVRQWLARDGATLADCRHLTVYSDSTNDLPLLELASEPVATNPSPALAAVARERGWRILRLFE